MKLPSPCPSPVVDAPLVAAQPTPYEPPRIEDDLPLEVMSLACQGFRPKASTPLPCRTAGS